MMNSWLDIPNDTDFTMHNFPFGIGEIDGNRHVVSRLGNYVINLSALYDLGVFNGIELDKSTLSSDFLNSFIEQGKSITVLMRERLIEFFGSSPKPDSTDFLIPEDQVQMKLPIKVTDYTDFYSSREHATNVGTMFRDPNNALLPNWLHMPVGYHGRASSIVVSGTDIRRPKGQQKPVENSPLFGPSKLLDFELEMGFIVGKSTDLGDSVSTSEAEDHIFGLALFNDWSARDIQSWEYVPLGPFLGKNFASTLSPWIVTLEALEPFRIESPEQDPEVLDYLKYDGKKNYNIDLFVDIITPGDHEVNTVCSSNFQYMYWNMCQQLAHQTVNGCNITVGDLYASGTISGKEPSSYGSMLELSWRGSKPLTMKNGSERKFIKDGDVVRLRGRCKKGDVSLGFGICEGKVLPAQ